MLDGIFKHSEEKQREVLEQSLAKGMQLLQGKFYNRAMIEFKKAMEINREAALPRLMEELDNFSQAGDLEATMSIGLNILQNDPSAYELANKLGNFARQLGQWEQASNLYKMALKAKKNYEPAFYNLAAAAAKVPLSDEAAKSSIQQFEAMTEYILPDYIGEDIIEYAREALTEKLQEERESKVAELQEQYTYKSDTGSSVEAEQVQLELTQLQETPIEADPNDLLDSLKAEVEGIPPEESKIQRYNIGIYALSIHRPKVALWAFEGLPIKEFERLDILKAISQDLDGSLTDAIDTVTQSLGENEFDRYNNVNLGLMFKKAGKRFLSTKYYLKAAYLLGRSNGLYSMKDLLKEAEAARDAGKLKKAFGFYEIISTEITDKPIWLAMGDILLQFKKYEEAVVIYRKLLKLHPRSPEADENLLKIHDYYAIKGDSLSHDRKFKPAIEYFRKAIGVLRLSKTLEKAAYVLQQLNLNPEADKLLQEIEALKAAEAAIVEEKERQGLISEAKALAKKKQWYQAVDKLEAAFRMKVDKQVFLQLAGLYKGLKRVAELNGLIERWGKMLEHADKMAKFEKEKQRAAQGDAEEAKSQA